MFLKKINEIGFRVTSAADLFGGANSHAPTAATVHLKQPPKWMVKSCGATWAFGGKLVAFSAKKEKPQYVFFLKNI